MKVLKIKLAKIVYNNLIPKMLISIINFLEVGSIRYYMSNLYISSLQIHPMMVYDYCEDKVVELNNILKLETNMDLISELYKLKMIT
jgi:hypothetical protein